MMDEITQKQVTGRGFTIPFVDNEIDLRGIFFTLLAHKKLILTVTFVMLFLGTLLCLAKVPQYQADVLLQVKDKKGGMGSLSSALMGSEHAVASPADVQTSLIKSRFILAPVIESLGLDIAVQPHYFPFFGANYAHHHKNFLHKPLFGLKQYAWGGENVQVTHLFAASEHQGSSYKLMAGEKGTYYLFDSSGKQILTGKVGQAAEIKNNTDLVFSVFVKTLSANPGTEFFISKGSSNIIANKIATGLQIVDLGQTYQVDKTGVLKMSLTGPDPQRVVDLLNAIATSAFKKDTESKAEEASKTLVFLNEQLPLARASLSAAEKALNEYRANSGSVDLILGSRTILRQFGDVQKEIVKTNLDRAMMMQKYTAEHPFIMALDNKKLILQAELDSLQKKLKSMPASDQTVINMMRDVKVKNTLYLMLLSKIQELQVIKAGMVSDIRILSLADLPNGPLPVGRLFIIIASLLLGLILGSLIVFVRKILHRTIQDPNWLEQHYGIPTFAIVPHSNTQNDMMRVHHQSQDSLQILAESQPRDVTIEALRSLRTSLQFALIGAKNNIISIMGVSPGIGKSFIAVNFSHVLASTGKRVLLIDGDIRKGYLYRYFGISREPGLSEVITGEVRLVDVIKQTSHANLDFISSGKFPPNPSELLMSEQFKHILSAVSGQYDLVVIDTAPILAATDCSIIGDQSGVNFLLIGAGKHQAEEIELAVKRLQNAGVRLQGAIFNNCEARSVDFAKSRYNYYYAYGEGETEKT